MRLFQHIFPNKDNGLKEESISKNVFKNKSKTSKRFHNVLCLNFTGNTHHLTIANAVEHAQEFHQNQYLQKSLLNTNNDVINFVNILSKIVHPNTLEFSIHGHIVAKDVKKVLLDTYHRIEKSNAENEGLIFYWSGHGKVIDAFPNAIHLSQMGHKKLYLSMARSRTNDIEEELVSLSDIVHQWNKLQGRKNARHPLLLVLDCCHSGFATHEFGTWGNSIHDMRLIMTSCTGEEISGGWIMDGANTGGILTNFLIDPIATYFKVQFNIFYDFGGNFYDTGNSPMRMLYDIFIEHAERVIDDTGLRDTFDRLTLRAGQHIATLYKHFLLLVRYGEKLYYPQHPQSFPDLSSCYASRHWKDMELEIEKVILSLWEERYQEASQRESK